VIVDFQSPAHARILLHPNTVLDNYVTFETERWGPETGRLVGIGGLLAQGLPEGISRPGKSATISASSSSGGQSV
jgi:hypothetical protein